MGRTDIGNAGTATNLLCDAMGHLQVDIVSGGGGGSGSSGTEYAIGDTFAADASGTLIFGSNAGNAGVIAVDADGHLQVDVLSGAIGDVSAAITNTVDISNAVYKKQALVQAPTCYV